MQEAPNEQMSLGDFLRQCRERKGVTIEQVAAATRISVRVLHALEGNHFQELPAKPFVRGFVSSYAQFIGLDPKQVLIDYDPFIDEKSRLRPNRESGHSGYAFEKKEGDQNQTVLWIVMGSFIVIGAIGLLVFRPSSHRKHALEKLQNKPNVSPSADADLEHSSVPPTPVLVPSPALSTPAATTPPIPVVAVPAPEPKPIPPPAVPAPTGASLPLVTAPVPPPALPQAPLPQTIAAPPSTEEDPLQSGIHLNKEQIKHKVIMKALADIWVRYQCDQRPPMKFILRKDKILVLRAETSLKVQVSNPNSMMINYNHGGNRIARLAPEQKELNRTATLSYPTSSHSEAASVFGTENPLPKTPDPAPEAASNGATTSTP